MRIGIDISQFVYSGGVGVYVRNLIKNLLKIDQKNQYLLFGTSLRKKIVLVDFYNKLKLNFPNVRARFYPFPLTVISSLFNQLRWPPIEYLTGKLDLFHTSDWTEPQTNCFKITTVHDLAPIIYPQYHHPKIVSVFKKKLALVKKEAKFIIAVSQSTKKDLVERLGIDEKKIVVIYEAVDQEFLEAKADKTILTKFKLTNYILSDAIKNPRKNLKNLILSFENIKNKDLKLVLIGEIMWQKKEQEQLILNSRKNKSIVLAGNVTLSELKALYQNAKASVFPSFYEGFGLGILEAMACNCPVIASNASSFPEVCGKAAVLINPNKIEEITRAINEVITNSKFKNELMSYGKVQIKRFGWEKAADETLKVYKSLITRY